MTSNIINGLSWEQWKERITTEDSGYFQCGLDAIGLSRLTLDEYREFCELALCMRVDPHSTISVVSRVNSTQWPLIASKEQLDVFLDVLSTLRSSLPSQEDFKQRSDPLYTP